MTTKKCTRCGEVKDIAEFGWQRKVGRAPYLRSRCKHCQNASNRATKAKRADYYAAQKAAHYRENRGHFLAYKRDYYKAHLERAAQLGRAYRAANKKRKKKTDDAWRRANKDRVREHNRLWRLRRVEQGGARHEKEMQRLRNRAKAWRAAHPEEARKKTLDWWRKQIAQVSDFYVRHVIRKQIGRMADVVPKAFITAKRLHLQLTRLIKEKAK